MTKILENINELSNSIFEKKMIIDSLQCDIEKHNEEYTSIQHQVWSADRESENKKVELEKLNEEIITDQKTYEVLLQKYILMFVDSKIIIIKKKYHPRKTVL